LALHDADDQGQRTSLLGRGLRYALGSVGGAVIDADIVFDLIQGVLESIHTRHEVITELGLASFQPRNCGEDWLLCGVVAHLGLPSIWLGSFPRLSDVMPQNRT
jgi:hypothetical protein